MQQSNKSIFHRITDGYCNGMYVLELFRSSTQRKNIPRWIHSLNRDYLFDTPSPWLVFDAIDYIMPRLFKGMTVFEYGSGGSTLFWLSREANVVSVEHDEQWFNIMKRVLKAKKSIDYRWIVPEIADQEAFYDPSDTEKYQSLDDSYRDFQFRDYVTQIDTFPDDHFDLVLIDGRARTSCIKHSIKKVKVGGLIILDNADREYYLTKNETNLENFLKIEFVGAVPQNRLYSKTNVYTKIK